MQRALTHISLLLIQSKAELQPAEPESLVRWEMKVNTASVTFSRIPSTVLSSPDTVGYRLTKCKYAVLLVKQLSSASWPWLTWNLWRPMKHQGEREPWAYRSHWETKCGMEPMLGEGSGSRTKDREVGGHIQALNRTPPSGECIKS